ncbi:MAG: DUF2288 family protein [Microcystis aeruginosa G11-06]|nr:DUF2288 family protein [Microcystis aeruginosa G11-06]
MGNIHEQLLEELAEVEWSDLIPHAQRDALIVVSDEKPTQEQLSDWNSHPNNLFNTLIVQPFVLIQTIA